MGAILDHLGPRIQVLKNMEQILELVQGIRQCAPDSNCLRLAIRKLLPEAVICCTKTEPKQLETQPSVRTRKKSSDLKYDDYFASVSKTLNYALEETETLRQFAIKWTEQQTLAVSSLFAPADFGTEGSLRDCSTLL